MFKKNIKTDVIAAFSVAMVLVLSGCTTTPTVVEKPKMVDGLMSGQDYLVTETRPNNIVLVDLKANKVMHECKTDESFSPGGIILSPDYTTAYIIGGYGEEVAGYKISTCEKVFHASLTQGDIKGQTLSGIAVSEDSKSVYAIYNRTKIGMDRYTVLDPYFSVYNVADGLNAKAVKSFKIPRQMTEINAAYDGTVYGIGSALYEINPKTGDIKVVKKIVGWDRKGFSDADSSGTYLLGQQQGEFTTLYTTLEYEDPDVPSEDGTWYWGITSVDLNTKEITQVEFTEYETLMFTAMRSPKDSNILYGSLNDLTKFDIEDKEVLKRITLDHTYYSVVPSPDGTKLYLGGCLDDIAIYDEATFEKIGNIPLSGDMGSASLQVFHK